MTGRAEADRLAEQRAAARGSGDFAAADGLRDRLRELGWEVVDTATGYELRPLPNAPESPPPVRHARSEDVDSILDRAPTVQVSVHWLVQGWPEDVDRGVESFRRTSPGVSQQHVVVEAAEVGDHAWPDGCEVLRVAPTMGWAAARNAGLRRADAPVVVLVDGSVEATGDCLGPLIRALDDAAVGLTGPFGIVSEDLREFRESSGPQVDAVEGYLMAFRRDLLARGVRFDERFRFYRTADIELSFQVKAMGLRAMVTPVPVRRHAHRMWTATPEAERDRLSKRNFYRFLDRWRGRADLLVANARP